MSGDHRRHSRSPDATFTDTTKRAGGAERIYGKYDPSYRFTHCLYKHIYSAFPGDTILTGSPGGVGKKRVPPLFLHDGDVIEVEIEHIGTLRNVVRDSRYLTSSVSWHDGRK